MHERRELLVRGPPIESFDLGAVTESRLVREEQSMEREPPFARGEVLHPRRLHTDVAHDEVREAERASTEGDAARGERRARLALPFLWATGDEGERGAGASGRFDHRVAELSARVQTDDAIVAREIETFAEDVAHDE